MAAAEAALLELRTRGCGGNKGKYSGVGRRKDEKFGKKDLKKYAIGKS
jgi:hypothetical protein